MSEVFCKVEGLDDILAAMDDNRVRSALKSGMRRVGKKVKTTISTGIRQRYNIKKEALDKRFSAQIDDYVTTITLKGKHIGLINFVNPTSLRMRNTHPARIGSRYSKQGNIIKPYVQVKVLKSSSYKTLQHAFIARSGSAFGVFERVGKSRLPIKFLSAPSVAQMANSDEIKAKINKVIHDDAVAIIRHAVSWKTGGEFEE